MLELIKHARLIAELPEMDSPFPVGTGALPVRRDLRLLDLASAHDVRRRLFAGLPETADLRPHVKGAYWQDNENSCAAYSTAGMQSIFVDIEHGEWLTLDAEEAYRAVGGYGPNPVDSRDVLEWVRTVGLRDTSTTSRHKIESYAHVFPVNATGILTIKAAISLNRPCVLAFYPLSNRTILLSR